MRFSSLLLFTLAIVASPSVGADPACDLGVISPNTVTLEARQEKVTPFWAQEAVGVYETKAFLKTIKLKPIPIEIWDGGFLSEDLRGDLVPQMVGTNEEFLKVLADVSQDKKIHGSKSLTLLLSTAPGSLNYSFALRSLGFTHQNSLHKIIFSNVETSARTFVSRALGFSTETRYGGSMEELLTLYDWPQFHNWAKDSQGSSHSKYFVNAAGNGYLFHFTREGMQDYAGRIGEPLLFVSSVLVNGEYDPYSGGGPKILVSAPGGDEEAGVLLPGKNGKTSDSFFTRTSAATQFVTSGLSLTSGLLGDLSAKQIEDLLKGTAIKTSAFPKDKSFGGYGVINHYLMARVAHKLSLLGRDLTPVTLSQALTDLRAEGDALLQLLKYKTEGCQETREALKILRRAFFLSPNNSEIRTKLSRIYADHNYTLQARYYAPIRFDSISPQSLERHMLMLLTEKKVDEVLEILNSYPETKVLFENPNYTATFLYAAEANTSEKLLDLVVRIEGLISRSENGQKGFQAYYQGFSRHVESLVKNPLLANFFFDAIPFGAFTRDEMLSIWNSVRSRLPQSELSKWRQKIESYGISL